MNRLSTTESTENEESAGWGRGPDPHPAPHLARPVLSPALVLGALRGEASASGCYSFSSAAKMNAPTPLGSFFATSVPV